MFPFNVFCFFFFFLIIPMIAHSCTRLIKFIARIYNKFQAEIPSVLPLLPLPVFLPLLRGLGKNKKNIQTSEFQAIQCVQSSRTLSNGVCSSIVRRWIPFFYFIFIFFFYRNHLDWVLLMSIRRWIPKSQKMRCDAIRFRNWNHEKWTRNRFKRGKMVLILVLLCLSKYYMM